MQHDDESACMRTRELTRERTRESAYERASARESARKSARAREREHLQHSKHARERALTTIVHTHHLTRFTVTVTILSASIVVCGASWSASKVASRGAGAVDIIGRSIAQFGGTLQGLASISLVSASSWCMHKVGGEMASEVSEASEVVDATGADARAAAAAVASGSGMILRQLIVVLHRDGATRTKSSFFSVFKLDVWSRALTEKPGKRAGKPGKAGKRMGNGPETPEIVWKRCRN